MKPIPYGPNIYNNTPIIFKIYMYNRYRYYYNTNVCSSYKLNNKYAL